MATTNVHYCPPGDPQKRPCGKLKDLAKHVDVNTLMFVSPPPDWLSVKCPICLELLANPHLFVCCGNHICSSCRNKLGNRPCPLCKSVKVERVPDKNHERALNSLRVYCPNHESGCHWSGEIKELSRHISKEDGDCKFELFSCKYGCGKEFLRPSLSDHETNSCCKYCRMYKSTCMNVTSVHYRVCSSFPVSCPNKCHSSIKRGMLDNHLSESCPLRLVTCPFFKVGCKWFDTENKLQHHVENCLLEHVTLASQCYLKDGFATFKLCREVTNLSRKNIEQRQEITRLSQQDIKHESKAIGFSLEESESDDDDDLVTMLSSSGAYVHIPLPEEDNENAISFIVDRWTHKCDHNNHHSSSVFKAGPRCTMQATVHCNGIRSGKGSHVSVCANIRTGYCSNVSNVFRGNLLITLLSPVPDYQHKYGVIEFDDTVQDCYCRPSADCAGFGIEDFIRFEELDCFLRPENDSLSFRIQYFA